MSAGGQSIPDLSPVQCALRELALGEIISASVLQSGMQCTPMRLKTSRDAQLVVKLHPTPPVNWFEHEALGLGTLAAVPGGPRVPAVHAFSDSYLLMDDLGDPADVPANAWEDFGRAIARLHKITSPQFGFISDNYLGVNRQFNPRTVDGHAFFIEHRVLRYLHTQGCQKWMDASDRALVERLCDRIRKDIPIQPASLLHGDLHSGNIQPTSRGDVATFDPAVHFGWAEAELSLADQFGGFPEPFWRAYTESRPLQPGWRERLPLYQLKELLAMMEQFGDTHGSLTDLRMLGKRFA